MNIGAIILPGVVAVYIALIVVLLNKRIDDLKGNINALQEGQTKLIASVAWLMARVGATPDEVANLCQEPQSDDD